MKHILLVTAIIMAGFSISGVLTNNYTSKKYIDKAIDSNYTGVSTNDDGIKIYPNPANHELFLKFELESKSDLSMEFYNLIGERVLVLANGSFDTGKYTIRLNLDDYALRNGIYYLEILLNDNKQVHKIGLVR